MDRPVALITGAGRGIGRALAVELGKLNYQLALLARSENELRETAKLAGESWVVGSESGVVKSGLPTSNPPPTTSYPPLVLPADVSKSDQVQIAVNRCVQQFGRLDAVIHCAGVAPALKIEETTDAIWHEVIDTNLSAAFYLARAAWPTFTRQHSGVIVNISSVAARDPLFGFAAYCPAKAGVNGLGMALAREGAPLGIAVHTIAPGATETAMFRKLFTQEQFPTSKALDPADVARVVARCVTGELQGSSGEVIWLHKTL